MALPAYAPEFHAPAERLHYFHPLRAGIAALVIIAADLGLTFWVGGGHATTLTARTSLLVALLLFAVGRTFQPRTLTADATEIRWKKALQPAQTVPRHEVAAIQYLATARPGAPRYYFVNRDGNAVLWVDRFTPARMGSFASYLGVPIRPVSTAPPTSAGADAAAKANAITGERRTWMVVMAVCAVLGLALTVWAALWNVHSAAELAAYRQAPLCSQASADRLACRFDVPAVVTAWNANGRIDIRFPANVPTFPYATTWLRMVSGASPDPGFGVGDTVQIEVFDGNLMAINGAETDTASSLQSNNNWFVVFLAGALFVVLPLVAIVMCWKGPSSWFVSKARIAAPSKPTLDDPPAVTDQPSPKEKPAAIDRVPISDTGDDAGDGWPTLVQVPGFDLARYEAAVTAAGVPGPNERLLVRAPVYYYGVAGTSSVLLLTDRRLVVLGPTRLEIPRARITLLAYWTVRDSIAITYRTMSGPHGILVTGPQLVLTGGPTTDMHRLFEAMQTALTNSDAIREPIVIVRSLGPWGRLTNRLWLAWVG